MVFRPSRPEKGAVTEQELQLMAGEPALAGFGAKPSDAVYLQQG
jgi:hypothetical protein